MDLFRQESLGSTTTTMINGKPSWLFLFLALLFFCFLSYNNYLNHNDDCVNHTNMTTKRQSQATQLVGAAMAVTAAVGARDMTRLEPLVCF